MNYLSIIRNNRKLLLALWCILLILVRAEILMSIIIINSKIGIVKSSINEIQIEMNDGWYPVFSQQSILGKALSPLRKFQGNGVLYMKIENLKEIDRLTISEIAIPHGEAERVILNNKTYELPWGSLFLVQINKSQYKIDAISMDYRLLIGVNSISALESIRNITKH